MRFAMTMGAAALCAAAGSADASLVIKAVVDGDLVGGTPKLVVLEAISAVPDLSIYGFGSANNGGGTDGEEFTFGAGSAATGDIFALADSTASADFVTTFFPGVITINVGIAASINGDDAIELFLSGLVVDTFGEIDVDGTGQPWEHLDSYAVRTGGVAGPFILSNYSFGGVGALDTLDAAAQAAVLDGAGVFTPVPEPASLALLALGGAAMLRRKKA